MKIHTRHDMFFKWIIGWILAIIFLIFAGGYFIYLTYFSVSDFTYESMLTFEKEDDPIKLSGFVNTTESQINGRSDAVKLAKKEVNFDYKSIGVMYDEESKIWAVSFFPKDDGMSTIVYMHDNGITFKIMDRN